MAKKLRTNEFRIASCLKNLYVAPNSCKILQDIENRQMEEELLKNMLS